MVLEQGLSRSAGCGERRKISWISRTKFEELPICYIPPKSVAIGPLILPRAQLHLAGTELARSSKSINRVMAGMPTSRNQKAGDFFHFGGSFNKKAGGRR